MTPVNPFPDTTTMLPAFDLDTEYGRAMWREQRRNGIGSSDASAAMGMSRWADATPWHLFMEKTGQITKDVDTEQTEIGREVEGAIVRIVARRLGVPAITGLPALESKARPWQCSNIDAVFMTDDGPIPFEAKNTSEYLLEEWVDQVPDHAELQILHTLAVTGAPYGYVGGMVGGRMVVFKRIDRDDELLDMITAAEKDIWDRVVEYGELQALVFTEAGIGDRDEFERQLRALEPPITGRDTVNSILSVSPRRDVAEIVVDHDTAEQARAWKQAMDDASERIKAAEADKAEARNNLVRIADGHDVIVESVVDTDELGNTIHVDKVIARIGRGTFAKTRFVEAHPEIAEVTQKKIEVLDVDALKREHPDLYSQFQARVVRGPRKNDPQ